MSVNSSDFQSKLHLSQMHCLHLFVSIASYRSRSYEIKPQFFTNIKTNQKDFSDAINNSFQHLSSQSTKLLSITTFPDYLELLFNQIAANNISENASNLLVDIKNNPNSITWIPSTHNLRELANNFVASNNTAPINITLPSPSNVDQTQESDIVISETLLSSQANLSQISELLQHIQNETSSHQSISETHLSHMTADINKFATTCLDLFKHFTPSSTKNEHYNGLDIMLDKRQHIDNSQMVKV